MSDHLHLRAFTGRPSDLGPHVSQHAINPASQPLLGCIPALTLPLSYAEGEAYRYGAAFMEAAIAICGAELASMLQQDMNLFEDGGLLRMGERKLELRAKYAALDHPAALEIVDWLDGNYAITGEMLQTQ